MYRSLPNILTMGRIFAIPGIVVLFYFEADWSRWAAFALYCAACITDYFDGKLARDLGVVSPLGRFLDPIADKLLIAALVVQLIAAGDISGLAVVAGLVILCREILVSGLREYLAEVSVSLPVTRLAKWKTGAQMVSLALLILTPLFSWAEQSGLILLWLAAALTAITGYDYLRSGLKHMMDDERQD